MVLGTQQAHIDPIKKMTAILVKPNLGLSSKLRKRGEEHKFKAGGTMEIRAMHEQHANLIKNKSRNVSEFVIILFLLIIIKFSFD